MSASWQIKKKLCLWLYQSQFHNYFIFNALKITLFAGVTGERFVMYYFLLKTWLYGEKKHQISINHNEHIKLIMKLNAKRF